MFARRSALFVVGLVSTVTIADAFLPVGTRTPTTTSSLLFAASQKHTTNDNDDDSNALGRRDMIKIGGLSLASLILGTQSAMADTATASNTQKKTILVTGCNSGIGYEATKRLAQEGHTIIMACRTLEKAQNAAASIQTTDGTLIPAECDLASLDSIQQFAKNLLSQAEKLDVVCYNAGLALNQYDKEPKRTKDGFELTGKNCA